MSSSRVHVILDHQEFYWVNYILESKTVVGIVVGVAAAVVGIVAFVVVAISPVVYYDCVHVLKFNNQIKLNSYERSGLKSVYYV